MSEETAQPEVVGRIEEYLRKYADAPSWGGPTIYPEPPSVDDLRALLALTKIHVPATPKWEPITAAAASYFIAEGRKDTNKIFTELRVVDDPDERMGWVIRGVLLGIADQFAKDDVEVAACGLIQGILNALSTRRLHFIATTERTIATFWRQVEDLTARGLLRLPPGSSIGFATSDQTIEIKDKDKS